MSNSDNPRKGAEFQRQVQAWFQEQLGPGFELETKIPIGDPAKDHKFDIVNLEKRIEHILPDSESVLNGQIGNLIPLESQLNGRCKDKPLSEKNRCIQIISLFFYKKTR